MEVSKGRPLGHRRDHAAQDGQQPRQGTSENRNSSQASTSRSMPSRLHGILTASPALLRRRWVMRRVVGLTNSIMPRRGI